MMRKLDAAILADYWLAVGKSRRRSRRGTPARLRSVRSAREVIALAEGIRDLAREGALRMIVMTRFFSMPLRRACASAIRASCGRCRAAP
jgi:hypothetical protein